MGFTIPCFIRKNTPELRKKLEEFRYVIPDITIGEAIFTLPEGSTIYTEFLSNIIDDEIAVDCGENEDLFLAIAALRDDYDRGQWFVLDYDNIWKTVGCYQYKGDFLLCDNSDKWYGATDVPTAHKATVEELIEHFK